MFVHNTVGCAFIEKYYESCYGITGFSLERRWSQKAFVRQGLGERVFQIEEVASRKGLCRGPVF